MFLNLTDKKVESFILGKTKRIYIYIRFNTLVIRKIDSQSQHYFSPQIIFSTAEHLLRGKCSILSSNLMATCWFKRILELISND